MPKTLSDWFIAVVAFFILVLVAFGAHAQPFRTGLVPPPQVTVSKVALGPGQAGAVLKLTYTQAVAADLTYSASLLSLRETAQNNRAPLIDSWAKATGTSLGSAWCGLFQWAIQKHRAGPIPNGPAGSYNWFKGPRTFFVVDQKGSLDSLKPADKVGFYAASLGRVGHIGMIISVGRGIRKGRAARGYVVRAGNTGTYGGRDGAGVHDYFYSASDIHAASRW